MQPYSSSSSQLSQGLYSSLSRKDELLSYREAVPKCAYESRVDEYAAEKADQNELVSMRQCVGPAVVLSRHTAIFFGLSSVVFGIGAFFSADCSSSGFAFAPQWLGLTWIPIALMRLWAEFRCLRYAMIPYFQTTRTFKLFGRGVSFRVWFIVVTMLSVLNIIDQATDNLVAVTTWKSQFCPDEKINQIWQIILSKSVFAPVGSFINFYHLILCSWLVLFFQTIYPVLKSIPKSTEWYSKNVQVGSGDDFINLFGEPTNLGDALYLLADASGMASLHAHEPARGKMREQNERERNVAMNTFGAKEATKSLVYLRAAIDLAIERILCFGLLENSVQSNLQTSSYGMRRLMSHGQVKVLTLA